MGTIITNLRLFKSASCLLFLRLNFSPGWNSNPNLANVDIWITCSQFFENVDKVVWSEMVISALIPVPRLPARADSAASHQQRSLWALALISALYVLLFQRLIQESCSALPVSLRGFDRVLYALCFCVRILIIMFQFDVYKPICLTCWFNLFQVNLLCF